MLANGAQLVGDYSNPILKPAAGAVVKQKGELAIAGKGFPNLSDQCRLYAPPFTFAMQLGFQMLQKNDGDITIIYNQDDNVRHIHMNATHPTSGHCNSERVHRDEPVMETHGRLLTPVANVPGWQFATISPRYHHALASKAKQTPTPDSCSISLATKWLSADEGRCR